MPLVSEHERSPSDTASRCPARSSSTATSKMRDAYKSTGYRVTDPLLAAWVNQGRPDA